MHPIKTVAIFLLLGFAIRLFAGELSPGDQVQDFTLKDYNGKEYSLSGFKDHKVIVIIFISTRCPVSNAYNQRMAEIYREFSAKNVAFLGINSNREETTADIKTHAKENGLNFIILKDENNVIADRFGATVTPEAFVLSNDLKVLYHGRIDDSQRTAHVKREDLKLALNAVLAGKAVSDASTRAFGCSIKRVN